MSVKDNLMLQMAFAADKMQRFDEARANYVAVLEEEPEHVFALCRALTIDGFQGRLADAEAHHGQLIASLKTADLDALPWMHLGTAAYQSVIRALPQDTYRAVAAALDSQLVKACGSGLPPITKMPRKDNRLRVGYLSSCLRDHPIGHVTTDLFAAHDRNRFDVHVFYLPAGQPNSYTERIRAGAEHFIELTGEAGDMALTIAAHDIDVLIYLDGYMTLKLLPVMALRPAAVQIFWLGNAGNCDLSCIDYFIADETVVPPGEENLYASKVIRLPGTYHCASSHEIGPVMNRAQENLPRESFVFCAFNNPEKIDLEIFEAWMRILGRVEGSVLWLSRTHSPAIEAHLREAAAERGVDCSRLVFATRVADKAAHLARQNLAGLFLDTTTLNASTTALDALWAGLPMITVTGSRFSSRISTSMLKAIGLEDTVCRTLADYEDRAVHLATHPEELTALRHRLERNKETYPLFDTASFCRKLEKVLEAL